MKINSVTRTDVFSNNRVVPTAELKDQLLLFDNFNGFNPIATLSHVEKVKFWQITIFTILQGSAEFKLNGEKQLIRAGQRLTTLPDATLEFISASDNIRFMLYVIYPETFIKVYEDLRINYDITTISGKYFIDTLSEADLKYSFNIYLETKDEILITPDFEQKDKLIRAYLNVAIANNQKICDSHTEVIGDTSSRQYDVYKRFLADLNKYSSEERSVNFYASIQDISAKYLSFVCIQYSGRNASSWIDEYVATKAKALISVHHLNTQQLCHELNFTSTSSFIRYFKRVTGVSPKEFANSLKK